MGNILAQSAPGATSLTQIYQVSDGNRATIDSIYVCNRSGVAVTFRVSIGILGAADVAAQYLYYDAALAANSTFKDDQIAVKLNARDVVRVYASTANLSFMVTGTEEAA